jgi:hypothetical protein
MEISVIDRAGRSSKKEGASAPCNQEGADREKASGLREMGIVRCDGLREQFTTRTSAALADNEKADRQQNWLEEFRTLPR